MIPIDVSPLVSLSIPIYKNGGHLKEAILSFLNQSFDRIDYIIIDDRGEDGSMDLVRNLVDAHPRKAQVRIITHPENLKHSAVRNTAMDAALAPYIIFMDNDDILHERAVETLYLAMKEKPCNMVVGSYQHQIGKIFRVTRLSDQWITNPVDLFKMYMQTRELIVPLWAKIYDMNYLNKYRIRCYEGQKNTVDDVLFTLQVAFHAQSVRFVSDIVYTQILNPLSTEHKKHSGNFREIDYNNNIGVLNGIEDLFIEAKDPILKTWLSAAMLTKLCNIVYLLMRSKMLSKNEKLQHLQTLRLRLKAQSRPAYIRRYDRFFFGILLSRVTLKQAFYLLKGLDQLLHMVDVLNGLLSRKQAKLIPIEHPQKNTQANSTL